MRNLLVVALCLAASNGWSMGLDTPSGTQLRDAAAASNGMARVADGNSQKPPLPVAVPESLQGKVVPAIYTVDDDPVKAKSEVPKPVIVSVRDSSYSGPYVYGESGFERWFNVVEKPAKMLLGCMDGYTCDNSPGPKPSVPAKIIGSLLAATLAPLAIVAGMIGAVVGLFA